jgi:hypothetical protein
MSNSLPMRVWSGTEWVNIGVQSGQVLYQNEEPSSPQTGSIWIDSDSETAVLNDQDFLTINSASAIYAPSASPTFSGQVNLPATTNYDGSLLSATLGSKLPIAGGKILQIVRATDSTNRSTTSTSYVDVTGMSVTITPQKSDSAIIIVAIVRAEAQSATDGNNYVAFRIADSSDNAISGGQEAFAGVANFTGTGTRAAQSHLSIWGYSTPAVITAVTYKLRFRSTNANVTVFAVNSGATGQMYAIEVSA